MFCTRHCKNQVLVCVVNTIFWSHLNQRLAPVVGHIAGNKTNWIKEYFMVTTGNLLRIQGGFNFV
jgi:hypothetical protein